VQDVVGFCGFDLLTDEKDLFAAESKEKYCNQDEAPGLS
jgi:hypothetical protein